MSDARDRDLLRGLAKSFGARTGLGRRGARWLDGTVGGSGLVREELRHVFPDHWSFFFGEIALYCFLILVGTGVYLALFFHASSAQVVYQGSYQPLSGVPVSDAYSSVLDLSFQVKAGLLVRQIHHWAALVFVAALIFHLFRMFFTGAYRRPRRINWLVGLSLLLLVGVNGVFGYSLPDDLLSGTGLRIAYSITESIPLVGPWMASLMFGGSFPSSVVIGRIYPVHIFLLPALIGSLLGLHMGMLWLQRHTQFRGPRRDERSVVGTPMIPAYALRTVGYFFLIAGVLGLLGAFVQINPVWLYGPYHPWDATTAAQPDWYTGWLEGAVRLWPSSDIHLGGYVLPGLFWPAVILVNVVIGFLFTWPWIDAFGTRDDAYHNLLVLPSERPVRTAVGAGLLTFLTVLLISGGNDVFAMRLGLSLPDLVVVLQVLTIALPPLVALFTYLVLRRRVARA